MILGALEHSIYLQRLDPEGEKVWPQPVLMFQNDSSLIGTTMPGIQNWGKWTSDGSGGVIVFWYDARGAYFDSNNVFRNSSIYARRVDGSGTVLWPVDGVKIEGPESGYKSGGIMSDGTGGAIIVWSTFGFGYPGSPGISYLKSMRINGEGEPIWVTSIDSGYNFSFYGAWRAGERVYVQFEGDGIQSRRFEISGIVVDSVRQPPYYGAGIENDTAVFLTSLTDLNYHVKVGPHGDTIWTVRTSFSDSCIYNGYRFIEDGFGGAFMTIDCGGDSILHLDAAGNPHMVQFPGIHAAGELFSDGNHSMVVVSSTTARRYDFAGNMIWPAPVTYMADPSNQYFRLIAPDSNGGAIAVFWRTAGGIYAQHSGRVGQVGVLTSVETHDKAIESYELFQNFPNPFNASTNIKFSIARDAIVTVKICDVLGREVATVTDQKFTRGPHELKIDGANYSSGIYFLTMRVDSYPRITKKLMLIR